MRSVRQAFYPATIIDKITFIDPDEYADGINIILVDSIMILEKLPITAIGREGHLEFLGIIYNISSHNI